jgi:hypothetical protein
VLESDGHWRSIPNYDSLKERIMNEKLYLKLLCKRSLW